MISVRTTRMCSDNLARLRRRVDSDCTSLAHKLTATLFEWV
jgi:hypothetical protein